MNDYVYWKWLTSCVELSFREYAVENGITYKFQQKSTNEGQEKYTGERSKLTNNPGPYEV